MEQKWKYPFRAPITDYRTARSLVPHGVFPDLTGVDARYTGGLRVFPGMRSWGNPFGAVVDLNFVKAIELRISAGVIQRGVVYRSSGGTTLYFSFYNTGTATWGTVSGQYYTTVTLSSATSEIDVTTLGKFIFIAEKGQRGKTIYWTGSAWTSETFGLFSSPSTLVPNILTGYQAAGPVDSGIQYPNDFFRFYKTQPGLLAMDLRFGMGVRLGDTRRGVWTPLITREVKTTLSQTYASPITDDQKFTVMATNSCLVMKVSISAGQAAAFDSIQVYRTVDGGATYFLVRDYKASEDSGTTLVDFKGDKPAGTALGASGGDIVIYVTVKPAALPPTIPGDFASPYAYATNNHQLHGTLTDGELVYQTAYDFSIDDSGQPPNGGLIAAINGGTVKICDGTETGAIEGALKVSNLYGTSGENYPLGNYFPPRKPVLFHSLVSAGDYVFALGNYAVYRMTRMGARAGYQPLVEGWGPVNRWASTVIGNSLVMVTAFGLVFMDIHSGEWATVGVMDKIVTDRWRGALSLVSLAFDAELGALVIHRASGGLGLGKEETYLLWTSTNTLTRVLDIQATQVIEMLDISGQGGQRAYFVYPPWTGGASEAGVYAVDASRPSDCTYTMSGLNYILDSLHGVIPTATSPVVNGNSYQWSRSKLGLAGDTLPADGAKGFYMYFVWPDGTVKRRVIFDDALDHIDVYHDNDIGGGDHTYTWPAGTRWFISPIRMEVMGWPLGGASDDPQESVDLFRRRKVIGVGAEFEIIEFDSSSQDSFSDPQELVMLARGQKQITDGINEAGFHWTLVPTKQSVVLPTPGNKGEVVTGYGHVPMSGHVACPGIMVLSVGTDYQALGMVAHGELAESEKDD